MNPTKQFVVPIAPLTDEGPWIPEGDGKWSRPLRFLGDGRGWVELMRLAPGVRIDPHRHTGDVHAYNVQGQRHLNTGEVIGPGDYVHESAGSVDWWEAVGDQMLIVHVVVMGAVEYLGPHGVVQRRITTADRIADYRRWCEASGLEARSMVEA